MSVDIPRTQKAAVYLEYGGPIQMVEIQIPEIQPDELLIRLEYSGVCHSDVHAYYGDYKRIPKLDQHIGGHEGCGRVVKIGQNAAGANCFKIGDPVGIKFLSACLQCEFCKHHDESNCQQAIWCGFRHDGTFQQFAVVKANAAVRIPANVELSEAAPILCAGWTSYRAVVESNAKAGQFVVITGAAGGLGSMAIQFANAFGLRVLGLDVGASKASICHELGCEFYIDVANETDVVAKVLEITGVGAHAVINMATSLAAIQTSLLYVRPRGTAVLCAMPPGALEVDLFSTIMRSITIKGSLVGNREDVDAALDFVSRGLVKSPIEIVKLENLAEAFERLKNSKVVGRLVLDLWN